MVVEVKFNDTIPAWLCTVLNRLDLQIERVSKYCYAVEALGLHSTMPGRWGPLTEAGFGSRQAPGAGAGRIAASGRGPTAG